MARPTTRILTVHAAATKSAAALAAPAPSPRRRRGKNATSAPIGVAEQPVQGSPDPQAAPAPDAAPASKQARIVAALRRREGATLAELIHLTGWLPHSVRGVLAGALKRKLGLTIDSRTEEGRGRVYRIVEAAAGAGDRQSQAAPVAAEPATAIPPRRRSKRRADDAAVVGA